MRQDSAYTQVSAEDLLEHEGVEYKATSGSRGPQFNIKLCPTCGDDRWKVYLSQDTGYGNCFKCENNGENFNLWTFAKSHLGTAENKAVGALFDRIATSGGWRPKRRAEKREFADPFDGALKLPTSIPIPDDNLPYLADRNVSVDLARQFGLRMCINGAFKYRNEDGEARSQAYTGRLLLPIYDLGGELVTFQGRDTTGKLDPKYLFPPRLPGTARFLYNGQRAMAEGWETIVLGEGAFDCIAIQRALDADPLPSTGACGSFGKKLTLDTTPGSESQLQALTELRRGGLKRVVIMWDGEQSALLSACDAAQKLTSYGFSVSISLLPPGKDPDECPSKVVRASIVRSIKYSKRFHLRVKLKPVYK